MNIEEYHAGDYRKGNGYRYFVPTLINHEWHWSTPELNTLLEKASRKLGELNSFANLVPNIDLFLQLHVLTEAVISSRIEGTQTNIDEALLSEEDVAPMRRDDWKEVRNYIQALNTAIGELKRFPVSSRLIRNIHALLLQGVRGEYKLPGEFRRSQNWIGGATINDAVFIPPDHLLVNELMSDLEKFLHNNKIEVPDLVRIGIVHYQFETIHPFLGGNGRMGRLLITLSLVSRGILNKPLLYLSKFFEKNKDIYYDNLMRVRRSSDLTHWLRYFLIGITQTAEEAAETLQKVLHLKNSLEIRIRKSFGRRTRSALQLMDHLFESPIVQIREVQQISALSRKAAGDLVHTFENEGILHEFTRQTRNRVYEFRQYLDLFR